MHSLPVSVICNDFPLRALLVSPETALEQVLEQSLRQPQKGAAIFLTDDEEILAGVIDPREMMIWGQMYMGLFPVPKKINDRKLLRLARAHIARDLALPDSHKMCVTPQTSVTDAIKKLRSFQQEAIAVVDEKGQVFNDLYIYELMAYAIRQSKGTIHA